MDHHEHIPTPDDVGAITCVLDDGTLVTLGPEQFSEILCLLPECPLNVRTPGGAAAHASNPAEASRASGGDTTSSSTINTGTRSPLSYFLLFFSSTFLICENTYDLRHSTL